MALEQSFEVADKGGLSRSFQAFAELVFGDMKKRRRRHSKKDQGSIAPQDLEAAISKAVKVAPGCEEFAGVIVQAKPSDSPSEPNWEIQGVRFGKADRTAASEALTTVVTRLQREFRLS
jgi:hypothetical protein